MNKSALAYAAAKHGNSRCIEYIDSLNKLAVNKCVSDFAIYTPVNSIQRFLSRYELMKLIKDIPGAVVEMGVCSGNGLLSLIQCHSVIQPTYNQHREFIGFDTFEGFPSVHANDYTTVVSSQNGDFTNNSYDNIMNVLDAHGKYLYVKPNVTLVKGDVCKTIGPFLEENKHMLVSLLYLDLDIYLPTKDALEKILPRMAKGSIIAFDEINFKGFPGETIAALEVLGTKYKFVNLLGGYINYCVVE
jgi:hypothetical protein